MRSLLAVALLALTGCAPLAATEWWVDAAAADGDGSAAARPFATLAAALRAARGGDTITVRAGRYAEAVRLSAGGTEAQPTVLRAAPGARVVLTGFAPLTGWQPEGEGLYVTTTDAAPADLFVGNAPQQVAWWPGRDEPMRYVGEPLAGAGGVSFTDPEGLADAALPAAVAAQPRSLKAFLFLSAANLYGTVSVTGLDPATGRVTLAAERAATTLKGGKDRYRLANHPALIREPGQWAFEQRGAREFRVWFRPAAADDLARTQLRRAGPLLTVSGGNAAVAHVRVEGLEVCGSTAQGVQVLGADRVTVERCLIHHNQGTGLWVRRSSGVTLRHNLVLANGSGIGVASSREVRVEGNEVGLNAVDGIVVAGNVTGRPDGEPESDGVTVRGNYVHHHLLLSHPDNFQTYRGVHRLTLEDNLALWGGQGLMTEETEDAVIRNCVLVGTAANVALFGHGNSHRWTVERSTIGLGGWGAFSLTGEGYALHDNLLLNNPLPLPPSVTSDHNLLWHPDPTKPVAYATTPRWRRFLTPAEAAEATGQEAHSVRADPQLRAAPALQAVSPWADANRANRLSLTWGGGNETGLFAVGDRIEVNGDGVLRRVTAVLADAIEFDPPLPARPFRDALIWNWRTAESPALDLRPREGSPALTAGRDGGPVGANLDIAACQRGDFDADGDRDLPPLPDDVAASLPNPNAVVVPLAGQ